MPSLAALDPAWFRDPARPDMHDDAPSLIVIDDFYPDPLAIRDKALGMTFVSYVPPDPAIVDEPDSARREGLWLATALVTYHGRPVARPFFGERHNPPELRARLEAITGEAIDAAGWATAGDWWNGAFHMRDARMARGATMIHHHYKPGDLERRGWSGVVYLSPDAPESSGTSIWRDSRSGLCVAAYGQPYESDESAFECVRFVQNRFNRLVLFRENVWHRAEHGFGSGEAARLTQTFFFETSPRPG